MKFLALRSLVLEPDLDLRFVQLQLAAQLKALLVVQVPVRKKTGAVSVMKRRQELWRCFQKLSREALSKSIDGKTKGAFNTPV